MAQKTKDKNRGQQIPNIEKLRRPVVGTGFAADLANVSRAATKLDNFEEYEQVSTNIVKILVREAEKGSRVLHFNLINPDRQFSHQGDLSRYSDVLGFVLKSKGVNDADDGVLSSALGCLPQRERYCVEKISRANRMGSWITGICTKLSIFK